MATLADGTTMRVRTVFFDLDRRVVNVQMRVVSPVYGTNDKVADFSLDDDGELSPDGDVTGPSGQATAFFKAMLAEPDSIEDWLVDRIGEHPSIPVERRDLTPERNADGTAYIPRN